MPLSFKELQNASLLGNSHLSNFLKLFMYSYGYTPFCLTNFNF